MFSRRLLVGQDHFERVFYGSIAESLIGLLIITQGKMVGNGEIQSKNQPLLLRSRTLYRFKQCLK